MKIDPTLFVGASGTIITILGWMLSSLIKSVKLQTQMQASIEQQGKLIAMLSQEIKANREELKREAKEDIGDVKKEVAEIRALVLQRVSH